MNTHPIIINAQKGDTLLICIRRKGEWLIYTKFYVTYKNKDTIFYERIPNGSRFQLNTHNLVNLEKDNTCFVIIEQHIDIYCKPEDVFFMQLSGNYTNIVEQLMSARKK